MGKWLFPNEYSSDYLNESQAPVDLSFRHIELYLKQVNEFVRNDKFLILDGDPGDTQNTRNKNRDFMFRYGITGRRQQKSLLLSVDPLDFCHVRRTNDGRELYVFCIERELQEPMHDPERVAIYIKHDFNPGVSSRDLIISLHPIEYPIFLPFRD